MGWVWFFINKVESGNFFFLGINNEGQCWGAGGFQTGTRSAQRDQE